MSKGWIKLYRNLIDWEWYDDINARILLIHLLLSVNYEDKKWKGNLVEKGTMVLSWSTLSSGCGLSVKKCRTAMSKLEDSGEVTRLATSKFQVVRLVKWDKLQQIDDAEGKPVDKQTDHALSGADSTSTSQRHRRVLSRDSFEICPDGHRQADRKDSWVCQRELLNGSWLKGFPRARTKGRA
jgi:hypothetical protein